MVDFELEKTELAFEGVSSTWRWKETKTVHNTPT